MKKTSAENLARLVRLETERRRPRSAWNRGVAEYAAEILAALDGDVEISDDAEGRRRLLFGADGWETYSRSGSSLMYDNEIAERLLPPSRAARIGNSSYGYMGMDWLEVQAVALRQAENLIMETLRNS